MGRGLNLLREKKKETKRKWWGEGILRIKKRREGNRDESDLIHRKVGLVVMWRCVAHAPNQPKTTRRPAVPPRRVIPLQLQPFGSHFWNFVEAN